MSGIAACTQWNVPVRFTASIRSHCSSVMSVNDRNSSSPALVTTISTGPRSVRTLAIAVVDGGAVGDVHRGAERGGARLRQLGGGGVGGVAVEVEQRDPVPVRRQPSRRSRGPCPMRRR